MEKSIFERWLKDEEEVPVHQETIEFTANNKPYEFRLIHNFHVLHLDIYKAFDEWSKQTREINIDSICKYILSQPSGGKELICYPQDTWDEFQLNQKRI